ncbi:MAG: type II secretion system F family protein [Alphaproteobacteria bacterium]|nr:type II secretion system F family protein [Alphaproteobacteria bacterium]MCB9691658.1 type II secretion system F family protein [Alphaproteobacteria bacterium]
MQNWILVVLLVVVFTAVLAVGQGLYWAYVGRQEQRQEDLRRRLGQSGAGMDEAEAESLFVEHEADVAANALGGTGKHIQQLIISADADYSVSAFFARIIVAGGLGLILGGIGIGMIGMVLAIPAAIFPYGLLRWQASKRTTKLVEQLPDTLELMARSLQAGMGLSDAFKLVAEEMPMPVAGEFGRVFEEVRFGRDYREAFDKMLDRNPGVFDLRLFVSSVSLQRETGGNLIEILNNIAGTIRSRFVFEAKVRAMTSEAKFTAGLLACLPIFVILALSALNPEYLTPLRDDIIGNGIVFLAFCMYGFGGWLMYEISNVEV